MRNCFAIQFECRTDLHPSVFVSAIPTLAFEIIFVDFEYSVECLYYEEFVFHLLRFCTAEAVVCSPFSYVCWSVGCHNEKVFHFFHCVGVRNRDYNLNVMEPSYSIARLQRREKNFRIHSKFLRNLFMNLKFNFFQLVRVKIFVYLVWYKNSKGSEGSNTA